MTADRYTEYVSYCPLPHTPTPENYQTIRNKLSPDLSLSTPPEPPKEEPTEPVFDIDYWISFAKSYAESIGLALDSGAVYCWDNPIAAGVKCKYTERDIRGYLDRYAKDGDITDVWIWYEQTGSGSYEIYIGYA